MNKASGIGIKGVLTLFILIFIASYLIYSKFLTSDQPRISSKTLRQIEKGEIPQNASELLGNVDSSISPWTSLLLAKSQELLGQKENALSSYQSIPSDSAASLEAKLAIFRLDKSYRSGERINELESQLQKTKRTKLLKEIDLIRAEILIQNKSYPQALSALQELRSQKINTSVAKKAKKLFEKNKNKIINQTPAFKIREIETLISEGSYKEALGLIENLKNEFKNDNLYFKLLLKEESALRKQGKNIEADDLLLLINADGGLGSADHASLKIAKNAWNIDDNEKALLFLNKLKTRFPKSKLLDQASYIKGRIEEEIDKKAAVETYNSIKSGEWKEKALKRTAWIYLLEGNKEKAAETFQQLDSDHAKYWLAFSRDEKAVGGFTKVNSYYNKDFEIEESDENCLEEVPDSLKERLEKLANLGLRHYAGYEIDYYFLVLNKGADEIRTAFNRAKLHQEYGFSQVATKEGLKALDKEDLNKNANGRFVNRPYIKNEAPAKFTVDEPVGAIHESPVSIAAKELKCVTSLRKLAYPLTYKEHFVEVANKHALDPALLFAIAHTESHFNPLALSNKNAVGLMQILPATAKELGLKNPEGLSDIKTNVSLGAQYIKNLLKRFNNNEAYAIAAYNAGPTAVNKWIRRHGELDDEMWIEMISYPETNDYVKKVLKAKRIYQKRLG